MYRANSTRFSNAPYNEIFKLYTPDVVNRLKSISEINQYISIIIDLTCRLILIDVENRLKSKSQKTNLSIIID